MILILIAILLVIIACIVAPKLPEDLSHALVVIATIISIVGIAFPISGYSEGVLKTEYELMPIIEETNVYVVSTDKENIICKYLDKSKDKKISTITEYDSSVKIKIVDKGTKPVLKIYSREPRRTWWTFALVGNKFETVVYVSEENLMK